MTIRTATWSAVARVCAIGIASALVACDGDAGGGDAAAADGGGRDSGAAIDGDVTPVDGGGPPSDGAVPRADSGPPDPACALAEPFDVGVTYASELYVATDGNDSADGSSGAPLATIRAAAMRATPGTRVTVRAGTYGAVALGTVAGTAGAPIAFVAEGDVTIDASSGTGWAMSDAAYVVVEGFTIADAAVHGMNIDDGGSYDTPSHHVVLRGLTVRDAGSGGNNDCIKMSGVDDFWVLGSDVSGCDRGEIIDMVGCHRGVISGNHFHDTVQSGVQTKGGSADVLVHANVFADIPGRGVNAGGSTGLEFFRPIDAPHEAARIRVVANTFIRNGETSGASIAFVGCDACAFVHNTVIEPRTWIARILQESTDARFVPSRDGVFANNVIVLSTADLRTFWNVGAGTSPETFVFARNLWYATDQAAGWSGPTYGGTGIPAETDGLVQMDPAMIDRAAGDYHLAPSSPAAGAGIASPFPLPPDHDGRCFADPPTLGAFEPL
jgi:hypothetical protein